MEDIDIARNREDTVYMDLEHYVHLVLGEGVATVSVPGVCI